MSRFFRVCITLVAAVAFLFPNAAVAGSTGVISGTVTDLAHHPIADVRVTAASPSATQSSKTDANGFYNIPNLLPDTYVVSFQIQGYEPTSTPGVTVNQDQNNVVNVSISRSLTTIASVQTRSQQNLVQPNQTADVYNISSQQLEAAQGGDNVHKTLYDFTQSVPGVTGAGANAQPRVRGGLATDSNFLYDDVPINDRLTGFFSTGNGYFQTTTISSVGVQNVQVYTGGFDARYGQAAQGVFNSVVRTGTYPGSGLISTAIRGNLFGHYLQAEYGTATRDRRFSAFFAYDRARSNNQFGDGDFSFPRATSQNPGQGPGPQDTLDAVANFHYRPNNKNDIQLLVQNGNGRFDGNYLLAGGHPVGVAPCQGVTGYWVAPPTVDATAPPGSPYAGFHITNPGVSNSGQPCVVTLNKKQYNSGLQYIALDPNKALETYHYSGVGKIQLNHIFNDKLSGFARLAENFNQYILNQPLNDPNYDNSRIPGQPAPSGAIPVPYSQSTRDFFGDRRQNAYIGTAELDWAPNANANYFAKIENERDNLLQAYYDRSGTGGYSSPPSAFDANGNWPNEYTLANQPFTIVSLSTGAALHLHKLVFAPSVRYDDNIYGVPKEFGGKLSKTAISPRLSFAYSPRPDMVIRGSYGTTSTFIPATYVFNNSVDGVQGAGQYRNPYLPGAITDPSMDHNVDLSFEKAFPDRQTSLRITPWYHQTNNRLEVLRNPALNPDGSIQVDKNGNPIFQLGAVAKSGGITKDFGVEMGLNHIVRGDGLSWFLSATYQSYFSTSFTIAAAAINPQNTNAYFLNGGKGLLFRVPDQPPVSVSFSGNYNYHRYHFLPFFLWQCCAYYNVQGSGNGYVKDPSIHTSPGYFYSNATLSYDIARSGPRTTRIGVRVTNVFDNQKNNVYPSTNSCYGRNAAQRSGSTVCGTFGQTFDGNIFTFSPGQTPNTLYFFPPVSRNPQTFELFLTQVL